MERQLDRVAAGLLKRSLENRGINFRMAAKTIAILGYGLRATGDSQSEGHRLPATGDRQSQNGDRRPAPDDRKNSLPCNAREGQGGGAAFTASVAADASRVRAVVLEDGSELEANLVVMAVGIRPNIELALAAGLRCDRGVLVNDTMQTFDPCIYAVGECVQHRNSTYGLVAPLFEQAKVCATHLAEFGIGRYAGSLVSTQLKVTGIDLFSAGDFLGGPSSETLVFKDTKRGIYKRLVIEDNRVKGAVLYGDVKDGPWYFELMTQRREIGPMRDRLLFGLQYATGES